MDKEKMAAKSIDVDELDQASGGSVPEIVNLYNTMASTGLVQKMKSGSNTGLAKYVGGLYTTDYTKILRECLGVKAEINKTSDNVYHDLITGRKMTHLQVIKRMKNYM